MTMTLKNYQQIATQVASLIRLEYPEAEVSWGFSIGDALDGDQPSADLLDTAFIIEVVVDDVQVEETLESVSDLSSDGGDSDPDDIGLTIQHFVNKLLESIAESL